VTTALCYFSGTGNTELVTRTLARCLAQHGLETRTYSIPYFLNNEDSEQPGRLYRELIAECRTLVILYPVYAFDAPPNVHRFVRGLPHPGHSISFALLPIPCDPHWINSAAAFALKRRLQKKGYTFLREELIVMPSNFLVAYPERFSRQLIAAARRKLHRTARELAEGAFLTIKPHPAARLLRLLFKIEHLGDNLFGRDLRAGTDCTLCGLCARRCPQGNIRIEAGRVHFGWRCIMCLRCVYRCPEGAIRPRFYRFVPLSGGYDPRRFPETSEEPAEEQPFVTPQTRGFYAHFKAYLFGR
jgi:ferredoxin